MRVHFSSLLLLAPVTSAYFRFGAVGPSKPAATCAPLSPFSAASLTAHDTGLDKTLEVAAVPQASPKVVPDVGGAVADPMGLWDVPKGPEGPRGPSVFKLNQGRAIDVLRRDYPRLLTEKPDFSIFDERVELHDPTGKRVGGLRQYEKIFDMLRFLRRTTMQDSQITYRLIVADDRIRVRWSAKLWMRDPALGLTTLVNGEKALLNLDGVSVYTLDTDGKIVRHTLETLVIREQEDMAPVPLRFAWPMATRELALPMPYFEPLEGMPEAATLARQLLLAASNAAANAANKAAAPPSSAASSTSRRPAFRSRSREPRASAADEPAARETPIERAARERAEDAEKAARLSEMRAAKPQSKRQSLFGVSVPQQCETSYDCEQPEVCCDLLFGKVCCTGGLMIPQVELEPQLQRQAIPIPVEKGDNRFPGPKNGNPPPRY